MSSREDRDFRKGISDKPGSPIKSANRLYMERHFDNPQVKDMFDTAPSPGGQAADFSWTKAGVDQFVRAPLRDAADATGHGCAITQVPITPPSSLVMTTTAERGLEGEPLAVVGPF